MTRRVSHWVGFLAVACWLAQTGSPIDAAVDEPPVNKLRHAVRLPRMNLEFKFGFTDSQDWVSESDFPDPQAELDRLRGRLRNELKDSEIRLEMARVATQLGETPATEKLRKAAVAAWRKWVAIAPGDRTVQTGLASALRMAREYDEAERVLRKITSDPDAPWEAWYELTTVLGEIGVRHLWVTSEGGRGPLAGGPAAPAIVIEESDRALDEALVMADKLVRLAPAEARAWSRRARILGNRALLDMSRRPIIDEDSRTRLLYEALFPEAAVPDLVAAIRLRPKDPRLLMAFVFHHLGSMLFDMMRAVGTGSESDFSGRLSATQQTAVGETVARLDRLIEEDDHSLAAAAAEYRAMVRLVVYGDRAGSAKSAVRAVRLDPARNQAFELTLAMAVSAGKPDWKLAEEVVRERLKGRTDARTRYALVKVLHESGRPEAALDAVHEAMKTTPGNARLEISHFALHLKLGHHPGGAENGPNLDKIGRSLETLPEGGEKVLLYRNYYVGMAVLAALESDVAGSRQMLAQLLEKVPDDEYAKEIDALVKQMN